MALTLLNTTH